MQTNPLHRVKTTPQEFVQTDLSIGLVYSASTNVTSIWDLDKEGMSYTRFIPKTAYALIESTRWVKATHKEWIISIGSGARDYYEGNTDAAQLWIDLHSNHITKSAYNPQVANTKISTNWIGIGRRLPISTGNIKGNLTVTLRRIEIDSYRSAVLTGSVTGNNFTGMMKTISSDALPNRANGAGWALDAELLFNISNQWMGYAAAEGLIGQLSWQGLQTEDAYITSPGVFTDPDGFLHQSGGISGMTWTTNLKARLKPRYRLDLMDVSSPYTLLSISHYGGSRLLASIGLALPQDEGWLSIIRCYPAQKRLEISAVGKGWELVMSGDDWLTASPKHGEVRLVLSPIQF
jgi:hypothetical protein